jgi:hypothetical protein
MLRSLASSRLSELVNLALRPEHRQRLERLREQTIAELRRTGAGFVERMPATKTMAR